MQLQQKALEAILAGTNESVAQLAARIGCSVGTVRLARTTARAQGLHLTRSARTPKPDAVADAQRFAVLSVAKSRGVTVAEARAMGVPERRVRRWLAEAVEAGTLERDGAVYRGR